MFIVTGRNVQLQSGAKSSGSKVQRENVSLNINKRYKGNPEISMDDGKWKTIILELAEIILTVIFRLIFVTSQTP